MSAASCPSLISLYIYEEQFNSGLVYEDLVCFVQDEKMCTTMSPGAPVVYSMWLLIMGLLLPLPRVLDEPPPIACLYSFKMEFTLNN